MISTTHPWSNSASARCEPTNPAPRRSAPSAYAPSDWMATVAVDRRLRKLKAIVGPVTREGLGTRAHPPANPRRVADGPYRETPSFEMAIRPGAHAGTPSPVAHAVALHAR